MSFLLVLVAIPYLALLVGATIFGGYWARKRGKKPWKGKLIGFLIVTLPVFWDWPLTVLAHQYYCRTEAGFWVYKTLDQWKAENPGVYETFVYENKVSPIDTVRTPNGEMTIFHKNQRIDWIVKRQYRLFINRNETIFELHDTKTKEILAKNVDYSTSGYKWWKFFLINKECSVFSHRDEGNFHNFYILFLGNKK